MNIAILTIFPEMFDRFVSTSIIGRACENQQVRIEAVDIRPFSDKKHHNTDDAPYGGGAGMVMMAQPICDAVKHLRVQGYQGKCIYLSPRGQTLTQEKVCALAKEEDLILLCGHYEGVDQRAIDLVVDEELSIGDYVLTGGELGAMVVCDAVSRYVPGVLGSAESTVEESFSEGLLEYPHYTRPREYEGLSVPEVLLGGNHKHIETWRKQQSLMTTYRMRPDLFQKADVSPEIKRAIQNASKEEDA